jgi:ankyrin repeat protein
MKFFIEHNADLNLRTLDGETPLHYAVRACKEDMARLLLQHHADPDIRVCVRFFIRSFGHLPACNDFSRASSCALFLAR